MKGPGLNLVIRNVTPPIFSSCGTLERILRLGSAGPALLLGRQFCNTYKVEKEPTQDAQGTIKAVENIERGTVQKSRWTCATA